MNQRTGMRAVWIVLATAAALVVVVVAAVPQQRGKQFLNVGSEKPPGYTHVVTSPPGRMIFISGQGGRGADAKMPPDFAGQCENTFRNLGRCLDLSGATFKDVVKINYFVTDLANTAELRGIRAKYLNMDAPPASTLVQTGLGGGMLLEVEVVAIIPER